jgi:hypothetical protein
MSVIKVSLRAPAVSAALVLAASALHAQPAPMVRLSVSTAGAQANGASFFEAMTPDGRHVVFSSTATNLDDDDTNAAVDYFLRDRDTDGDGVFDEAGAVRTIRVSEGLSHQQSISLFTGAQISPDGRFVLFATNGALAPGDTNGDYDAYLRDRDADGDGIFDEPGAVTVTQASTGTGNSQANGMSRGYQIAGNGRYVLFTSNAPNLRGGQGFEWQFYRKDLVTSVTTMVTAMPDGTPADTFSIAAALSPDGTLAAFAGGFSALTAVNTWWVLRNLSANTFEPIVDGNPPTSVLPLRPGTAAPLDLQGGWPGLDIGFTADAQTLYLNTYRNVLPGGGQQGSILEYDLVTKRITSHFPGVPLFADTHSGLLPRFRDGRALVFVPRFVFVSGCTDSVEAVSRYDRVTKRVVPLLAGPVSSTVSDATGRRLLYRITGCTATPSPPVTYLLDSDYGTPLPLPALAPFAVNAMDDAGTTVVFFSGDATLLPGGTDTNGELDVFAYDLRTAFDRDTDLLDDRWEAAMGLDYTSSAGADGASGDPDGDGLTNAQEFQAGSHPRGGVRSFLAEGADNAFFHARLGLANAGTSDATAVVRLDGDEGSQRTINVKVPAGGKRTVFVDEIAGHAASFATVVESGAPLVVDRTMSWGAAEYGAHAERASPAPSMTWFLAEGSTGGFGLFYLLQNPGDAAATATVRYLRPSPLAPIDRVYTLPPRSRTTVPVNTQAPELAATDVSAAITATAPILVERAMYRTVGDQVFAAGHDSAAVTAPATSWFLAEGATGSFFDLFVLIANPTTTAADVQIRYLLTDGTVLAKSYAVPAESRRTIYVDDEDFGVLGRALANATLSCAITVTNAVPIVVERSMWFPGPQVTPAFWTEAHNSPGATGTARRWALADGEAGGTRGAQTFVLIANTSATAGRARITVLPDTPTPSAATRVTFTVDLPANSRTTVPMHGVAGLPDSRFGVLVESIDTAPLADLVVKRAMYWNAGGETWAAGTNLLATPLP